MSNKISLSIIRLIALVSIIAAFWFLFSKENKEEHEAVVNEANIQKEADTILTENSELTNSSDIIDSDNQTILQVTSPMETGSEGIPLGDLGGIDNIPTPEMLEEMQAFAPEAGDDGIEGDPPEAGDDGIIGDPPEAGDSGFLGEPPEGYNNESMVEEELYIDGPGGPNVTE